MDYICLFTIFVRPALESVAGLETLSMDLVGIERTWELLSKPQGWILCLGYLPVHYTYVISRARLAGESTESYWG